ncbi:uncharacterized protein N7459_008885 [Penicillium hispanicum]|uniref:uncharacterized protein n=1 Tax=Penicillium hispanicum TaxID=1080232 RepID=UPI0025423A6C|nr:uncharacterized protein N7459_008885 [Penicillium hispanicum]KAJ5569455.1 hypothetical protein N7459_008885 [Penicillium hispanicum]
MKGTVLITGATGSLGLQAVRQLLASHSSLTVVGTVRNATKSPKSPHLLRLEELSRQYPSSQLLMKSLDLDSLSDVESFARDIASQVESGQLPPISAIICNAFMWSLNGQKFSKDGFESGFQVNHLAHFSLVLRLLRSMNQSGRVVMIGSEVYDPDHVNPISKLGANINSSENLDYLVKPGPDQPGTEHDMGWQRYANSKLANVMFMMSLNQRLQQEPQFKNITVTAMDPGGLVDSRAHTAQRAINQFLFKVFAFLLPVISIFTNRLRSNADSARDVVALALDPDFESKRGYFDGRKPITLAHAADVAKRESLWTRCWEWTKLKEDETCVPKELK